MRLALIDELCLFVSHYDANNGIADIELLAGEAGAVERKLSEIGILISFPSMSELAEMHVDAAVSRQKYCWGSRIAGALEQLGVTHLRSALSLGALGRVQASPGTRSIAYGCACPEVPRGYKRHR
jgi:hypothetical protein